MSDGSDAEVSKPWLMVATVALAAFAGGIVVGRSFNRHDSAVVATTVAITVPLTVPGATVPGK